MCMCMCMCIYVRPRAHPTGDRNVTPKPKHKSGNLNVSPIFTEDEELRRVLVGQLGDSNHEVDARDDRHLVRFRFRARARYGLRLGLGLGLGQSG